MRRTPSAVRAGTAMVVVASVLISSCGLVGQGSSDELLTIDTTSSTTVPELPTTVAPATPSPSALDRERRPEIALGARSRASAAPVIDQQEIDRSIGSLTPRTPLATQALATVQAPAIQAATIQAPATTTTTAAPATTTTVAPTTTTAAPPSTLAPTTTISEGEQELALAGSSGTSSASDPTTTSSSSSTSAGLTDDTPDPDLNSEPVSAVVPRQTTTQRATTTVAPVATTVAPAPRTATTQAVQRSEPVKQTVGQLSGSPTPASGNPQVAYSGSGGVNVYSYPLVQPNAAQAATSFKAKTQFGSPTTFLVTATQGEWVQVLLPIRQIGTVGWIHSSQIRVESHTYRALVDLSDHSVKVFNNGSVIAETKVVTGKASRPTPKGRFFITDKLRHQNPGGAYGPWILATSARSQTLLSFNGGEPIVALHGTNKPWLVGGNYSSGCIRMPNDVITFLAEQVPLGTPVDIVA